MVTLSIARFLFWLGCSIQNYNGIETDTFVYDYINPTSNKASALLRSVTYNGVTTSYTYDNLDRLTSVTTNNETTSYSYNSNNELITSLSDNRQYYYSGNRITSITLEDNSIINFTYDYLGRRLTKNDTKYVYFNNLLVEEHNRSYRLKFLYDEYDNLYGFYYNDECYFYLKNSLGIIYAIIDQNGNKVVEYTYDPWGKVLSIASSNDVIKDVNPFIYKSYYYDRETGLYWLSSRLYDPVIGKFLTRDDINYLDIYSFNSLNLYAYCGNDPVMNIDPSGHMPEWLQGLAIGLAIVGAVLVIGAVTVLTCGVGTLAGTMAGALIYGAAQGIAIGAAVGVVGGGIVGGIASDWSAEGILIGMGIGLGAGAIVGGVIGGFAGASSFTANSAYISQYGGNVKEVLSAYKGNPRLKVLNSNTTAYRTWGGTSGKFGHWISPKNYGSAARSMLSLPPGNTAANTSQFLISKGSTVLSGKAAALFGQTGGGIQWWIGLL